jgi:hypothetical protein
MISVATARRLRDSGLRWDPQPGDRFIVADRDMDAEVFTLSNMTIEVHEFPGEKLLGFNGTTEWALDSIDVEHSVWLPSEAQLRERLAGTFCSLERSPAGWRVITEVNGARHVAEDADAAEAYGAALLHLVTGE